MNKLDREIKHCMKTIEHCVSVIALCKLGGHPKAEASYEAYLAKLNKELEKLLKEKNEKHD